MNAVVGGLQQGESLRLYGNDAIASCAMMRLRSGHRTVLDRRGRRFEPYPDHVLEI